ncbi:MAG: CZB domain-containing protein [Deferribacteraceae bacterium]|nr:CZB domain-containing protein [Deferribacteraceae bacterium]
MVFYSKVTNYVMTNGQVDFAATSHHECRLGKWYDSGQGKQLYSQLKSYRSLEAPHGKFHALAQECKKIDLSTLTQHSKDHLKSILLEMSKCSGMVCDALDAIMAEKSVELDKLAIEPIKEELVEQINRTHVSRRAAVVH